MCSINKGYLKPAVNSSCSMSQTMLTITQDIFDGHNTFNGMGIIATVTQKVDNKIIVPRTRATSDDLMAIRKINIHFYKKNNGLMEQMVFQKLTECSNVDDVSMD